MSDEEDNQPDQEAPKDNVFEFKPIGLPEDEEDAFLSCPECDSPFWCVSADFRVQCGWCDWELNFDDLED